MKQLALLSIFCTSLFFTGATVADDPILTVEYCEQVYDLYTNLYTQWYYVCMNNASPGLELYCGTLWTAMQQAADILQVCVEIHTP